MTHGNHINGLRMEQAIQEVEQRLTIPSIRPSKLLDLIAMDAVAAVFRDDAAAIAALPVTVHFKALAYPSRRYPGQWRLLVITQSQGAWGHHMSGPCPDYKHVEALAEMINGPVPSTISANSAIPSEPAFPSTRWAVALAKKGLLGKLLRAMTPAAACGPLSAAERPSPFHKAQQSNQTATSLSARR